MASWRHPNATVAGTGHSKTPLPLVRSQEKGNHRSPWAACQPPLLPQLQSKRRLFWVTQDFPMSGSIDTLGWEWDHWQ